MFHSYRAVRCLGCQGCGWAGVNQNREMEELKDNRLRDSTEGRAVAWGFELEREDDCMGETSSNKDLDHAGKD